MSKTKFGQSTLSGLIDSDSDSASFVEHIGMPTPESGAENLPAAKKGRGRPKATMPKKVTKSKAPARRTSGRLNTKFQDTVPVKENLKKEAATKKKRKALTDKTNKQDASDTEEVDEFEQDEDTVMADELKAPVEAVKELKPKSTMRGATARGKATKKSAPIVAEVIAPELEPRATTKRGPKRQVAAEPSLEKVISETQVPAMEIENISNEGPVEEIISKTASNVQHLRSNSRVRHPSVHRRRAGSASDTERGDPTLRRKLGEITKKYDNLNNKYQDLREIGLKEAERNFERLRKQSDEKTAGIFNLNHVKGQLLIRHSLGQTNRLFES